MLVREGHRRAAELGYGAAVVLGHEGYYPRFGYRRASLYGIRFPFDAPDECCMAAELFIGGHGGGICRGDEESISRTAWRSRPGRPGKRTLQITLNCPELCRRFHNFSIRHLPDMRRVEWLKKNSAGSREAVDELK